MSQLASGAIARIVPGGAATATAVQYRLLSDAGIDKATIGSGLTVAAKHPAVLQELIALWYVEAGKYNVLPITGPDQARFAAERPQPARERDRYIHSPGTQTVPGGAAVNVLNRSHVIAAVVDVPEGGAEGVLLTQGGGPGGYVLFVQDNKLHYVHNYVGSEQFHVVSEKPVPEGRSVLSYQFEVSGPPDLAVGKGTPGTGTLFINDEPVGSIEIPYTIPLIISIDEGLTCGRDTASAVVDTYEPPFSFTGTLHRVAVDVSGERIQDHEAEIRHALARQ